MGGNSSYSKEWGRVPSGKLTHTDTHHCIDGHKIVLSTLNPMQNKNILNSNSSNATYIIAKKQKDGTIEINSINVFKKHEIDYEINLKFDSQGNILPFNNGKGSHAHLWYKDSKSGELKRESHDKKNSFPIEEKYKSLISKIEFFNKQKHKAK